MLLLCDWGVLPCWPVVRLFGSAATVIGLVGLLVFASSVDVHLPFQEALRALELLPGVVQRVGGGWGVKNALLLLG